MNISKTIMNLIDRNAIADIVPELLRSGIPNDQIGQTLLRLAMEYVQAGQADHAMCLLDLVFVAMESSWEKQSIAEMFSRIMLKLNRNDLASLCLEKVGRTQSMLQEDVENQVVGELEQIAGQLRRSGASGQVVEAMQDKVNGLVRAKLHDPTIMAKRDERVRKNLEFVAKNCNPATVIALREMLENFTSQTAIIVNGCIFELRDVWHAALLGDLENQYKYDLWRLEIPNVCALVCESVAHLHACFAAHVLEAEKIIKTDRYIIVDFQVLLTALSVLDFSQLGLGGFVFNFLDSRDLTESWRTIFNGTKNMPPMEMNGPGNHGRFLPAIKKLFSELENNFLEEDVKIRQELERYYRDYIFTEAIKEERQKRVLFISSRFTTYILHSARDLAKGFDDIGWQTEILIEDPWSGAMIRHEYYQNMLAIYKPDLIVNIDHLRYENPSYTPENIPYVTWVQDYLPGFGEVNVEKNIGCNDHIFFLGKRGQDYLSKQKEWQGKKIHLLTVPLNTEEYAPILGCSKKYDVTFVSHLPSPEKTLQPFVDSSMEEMKKFSRDEVVFLGALCLTMNSMSTEEMWYLKEDEKKKKLLARKLCKENSLEMIEKMYAHLSSFYTPFFWEIMLQVKIRPIKYLINNGVKVRVFGNNWDKYGFSDIAMGPIENGKELNKLINESKINLNNSPGLSYHMKAPEVIGAKGFMLSRSMEDDGMPITDLFEEGAEVVVFSDKKELLEQVVYYLDHAKEREQIADRAYRKMVDNFTVNKAAEKIIATIVGYA